MPKGANKKESKESINKIFPLSFKFGAVFMLSGRGVAGTSFFCSN
ncbi:MULTISPECIES: hypothetical protein [Bacillota]|nr:MULTISPECIES: hypothetical protein [Bacillota]